MTVADIPAQTYLGSAAWSAVASLDRRGRFACGAIVLAEVALKVGVGGWIRKSQSVRGLLRTEWVEGGWKVLATAKRGGNLSEKRSRGISVEP
jgi:hypothetical protein